MPGLFEKLQQKGFDIQFESHAFAILEKDFPAALLDLEEVLSGVSIPISEIIGSGGGEAKGTQRLRRALNSKGWQKQHFEIRKTINKVERECISHEVDHAKSFTGDFKGNKSVALEIKWNNKDGLFSDRPYRLSKCIYSFGRTQTSKNAPRKEITSDVRGYHKTPRTIQVPQLLSVPCRWHQMERHVDLHVQRQVSCLRHRS